MARFVTEFLGTFFLMFTIAMTTIAPDASPMAPLAIGFVLMVMVYAGGPVSGAHYNPAVTFAVLLREKISPASAVLYVIAQALAAIVAGVAALALKGEPQISALEPNLTSALTAEALFTFALAFVVLSVATAAKSAGNSYFGFAIGGTVMVGAMAVGPVSGGVFNPAVGVGLLSLGILPLNAFLAYTGVQLVAGGLAAVVFRLTNRDEFSISIPMVGVESVEEIRRSTRIVG